MSEVYFYSNKGGPYALFSNFASTPITIEDEEWPTVEHYFQSRKTLDEWEREKIRRCSTPWEAKKAGRELVLRKDWYFIREKYMLIALRAKFTQYPGLRQLLLDTKQANIHEESPTDTYWGYAFGKGKDRLGKLLMQVREELEEQCPLQ